MCMWLSNGLHHLWCEEGNCYCEGVCQFCGRAGVEKYHTLRYVYGLIVGNYYT